MGIQTTKLYADPETNITVAVREDDFELIVGKDKLVFSETHSFPLQDQLTHLIDLCTAAKIGLETH